MGVPGTDSEDSMSGRKSVLLMTSVAAPKEGSSQVPEGLSLDS